MLPVAAPAVEQPDEPETVKREFQPPWAAGRERGTSHARSNPNDSSSGSSRTRCEDSGSTPRPAGSGYPRWPNAGTAPRFRSSRRHETDTGRCSTPESSPVSVVSNCGRSTRFWSGNGLPSSRKMDCRLPGQDRLAMSSMRSSTWRSMRRWLLDSRHASRRTPDRERGLHWK